MVDFIHNEKAINKIISLNETDIERKHKDLRDFYKEIQTEFNDKLNDKSITDQFKDNDYLNYFSRLIDSLVKLENNLYNGESNLFEILETKDGNLFRLNNIDFLNNVKDDKDTDKNLLLNSLGIFRRSYYKNKVNDECYSFYDLSTGEQRLLRFFADILSLKDRDVDVYVFDEMDLSWHPEWQRKMVYYIKDFFDKCNSEYKNIIFTTHSPFILSDMPANNVVMLYRDSSGISQIYQNTPNSFCANIHDLFNDNFFFNNCNGICTIGEVAKNHIENVKERIIKLSNYYKYNNLKNSDNFDFAVKVISLYNQIMIISEPVIRKSLLKEFMERYGYILFNNPARLAFDYVELRNKYDKLQKELNEKNKPER